MALFLGFLTRKNNKSEWVDYFFPDPLYLKGIDYFWIGAYSKNSNGIFLKHGYGVGRKGK